MVRRHLPLAAMLLAAARDLGVTTIVNLRQAGEEGNEGEPERVAELGLEYVAIPVGGVEDLSEENALRLADVVSAAAGSVVVHCASGNRVGGLFAVKAFRLDGLDLDAALEIGRAAGLRRLEPAVHEALAPAPAGS